MSARKPFQHCSFEQFDIRRKWLIANWMRVCIPGRNTSLTANASMDAEGLG